MRVLLVYAVPPMSVWPKGLFISRWVPTGLAQIAAELRHAGHDVRVEVREEQLTKLALNWDAADKRLDDLLSEFRPQIVGISVVTPAMVECGAISAKAKALLGADVLTIAGGPHPTALPDQTLNECPDLDAVAVGEAEATMVELTERGLAPDVAGLVYRRDGEIVHTPPRKPWADLDTLQPIPYDLFDMAHYTEPNPWMIRWLTLSATNLRTSRGCPGRCRFCAGYVTAGVGIRFHSVDYVLARMEYAIETLGVQAILFEDETLGADGDRLRQLCEGIRQRGWHKRMQWSGCLRVEQAEPDLLTDMRSAGCIQIEYGFETGSDRMLKALAKNASVAQNRRAVELTRAAGIRIFADIMVGLPGETADDLQATVDFLRWAAPDIISAGQLVPLPGTPIYNGLPLAQQQALAWPGFAYPAKPGFRINLSAMSDDEFHAAYRRFRRYVYHPAVDRQLLRDTPVDQIQRRREIRRRIVSFALRHPIRAARLPC